MYKCYLISKNILATTLLILLLNFVAIKNSYAINDVVIGSSDNQKPQNEPAEEAPVTNINVPSENIKKIPIIGYKFVYKTYNASLVDFLEKPIENLRNNLIATGIKEKNIVIIFTDYIGYTAPLTDSIDGHPSQGDSASNLKKYTTDEGQILDLTKIGKNYPITFLATKRKVLIGTLVDNNNAFNGNQSLSVTKFNIPDASGFQYFSKDSYLLNTTNQPKANSDSSKQDTTGPVYQDNQKEPTQITYTKEELVEQRANMIQYMNLAIFNRTSFIGMMEYHDLVNNIYAYFALPGDLQNFLYPKDDINSR